MGRSADHPLQVSGPAAGLTVVVAGLVAEFGWGVTCLITAAAGAVQVLLGLSRVARGALAISPVVVHAMLAGIGVTIALQQAHVLLGGKSKSTAWHNVIELPGQIVGAHRPGVLLGVLVIVILSRGAGFRPGCGSSRVHWPRSRWSPSSRWSCRLRYGGSTSKVRRWTR